MKQSFLPTLIALSLIFTTGCNSSKSISSNNKTSDDMLYYKQWKLLELNGTEVTTGKASLVFQPGKLIKVSGNAGCNIINGNIQLKKNGFIKFSPLATTLMACEPGIRETEFLDALDKSDNYGITNSQLLLKKGELVIARFGINDNTTAKLDGDWQLNYISGPRITFDGLYPQKKPVLSIKPGINNQAGGNTSCNIFSSKMAVDRNKISFTELFAKTKIFCQGAGEETFLNMLKKVNNFSVNANTLTFLIDDIAVMRFTKL